MDEKDFLTTWVNYGIIVRLPYKEIELLKKYLLENNIKLVYDTVSIGRIYLRESIPTEEMDKDDE